MFLKTIIKTIVPKPILTKCYSKYLGIRNFCGQLLILKHNPTPKKSILSTIYDYIKCYKVSEITATEYLAYEYYKLSPSERREFITVKEAQNVTRAMARDIRDTFWNKELFLDSFSPKYVTRDWLDLKKADFIHFSEFCKKNPRFFCKLPASTWGIGAKIIDTADSTSLHNLYAELKSKNYILEKLLTNPPSLRQFHPDSLNTIRVMTINNGKKAEVLWSFIRFGNGSYVDNAHGGGLWAHIDVKSGVICTNAFDGQYNEYAVHPITGVKFEGFQIPQWKEITEQCLNATNHIPKIRFAGWDVTLLDDDSIEIIEGNHMPDFDVLQAPEKVGVYSFFKEKVSEYFGDEFLEYFPKEV